MAVNPNIDYPVLPNIPADQPYSGNFNNNQPFRFWCQKVLPLVYDDSLSYYELLCKVVDMLNKMLADVNTMIADNTGMRADILAFRDYLYKEGETPEQDTGIIPTLQSFVNQVEEYFDNLDVQNEINNKLDEMALTGVLSDVVAQATDEHGNLIIPETVGNWLSEHLTPTNPPVDNTLSIANAAADAKATGDLFYQGGNRQLVTSACNLRYNSMSNVITSVGNIRYMHKNTRVYMPANNSSNVNDIKNFIKYPATGDETTTYNYPIDVVLGHAYVITKTQVWERTSNNLSVYTIQDLNTAEIVYGQLNEASASAELTWHKSYVDLDTTLRQTGKASDSKSVGDSIYREANTNSIRGHVTNKGRIKYEYSASSQAISELSSIGVNSPFDMIDGSEVSFDQTNMTAFLTGTDYNLLPQTLPTGNYSLKRDKLYGGYYIRFILSSDKGDILYHGLANRQATTPAISWGENCGAYCSDGVRQNIMPLPLARYTPPEYSVGSPWSFNPWDMPENSVAYYSPLRWYEDITSQETPKPNYINLDRSLFTQDGTTDGELSDVQWQLIKYSNRLELINAAGQKYFYGIKYGTTQRWGTVGISNAYSNTNYNTFNSYTTQYTGEININPTINEDVTNILSPSGGDDTQAIYAILNTSGKCILSKGVFNVSGLTMPKDSFLFGSGNSTVLVWSERSAETPTNQFMIQLNDRCTISNLRINAEGSTSSHPYVPFYGSGETVVEDRPIPDFSAILFTAIPSTPSNILPTNCVLENIVIHNCKGTGIKTVNTTTSPQARLFAINCSISNCECGIYNAQLSEFHKFTNVQVNKCYYGCIVEGGNIDYTACTFNACHYSIIVDGTPDNSSHGTFCNVAVVHTVTATNTTSQGTDGFALVAKSIIYGEKFEGCKFGYGKITLTSSKAVKFNDCGFGTIDFTLTGCQGIIYNDCAISRNVTINRSSSNNVRIYFNNSYDREGYIWSPTV